MKLTLTVKPNLQADVTAEGLTAPISIQFKARGDKPTSAIVNPLPTAIQALGTATNLTLPIAKLVDGAVFDVESHPHGSRLAGSNGRTSNPRSPRKHDLRMEVTDVSVGVYEVASDGSKAPILTIEDDATRDAYGVWERFQRYQADLIAFVNGALKTWQDNHASTKAGLIALGMTADEVDKLLATKQPMAPKFADYK